jgi:hypothetical protein
MIEALGERQKPSSVRMLESRLENYFKVTSGSPKDDETAPRAHAPIAAAISILRFGKSSDGKLRDCESIVKRLQS